jgi:hypothetical protein
MAVTIAYRHSGGASNSDPTASLGGAISSNAVATSIHGLFDQVSSAEASAGDIEYRCLYVINTGTTTAETAKIWIQTNTSSADTTLAIALAGEGKNGTAEVVGAEGTAPTGESFSSPADLANGLALGNLAQNDYFAVWVRRTVTAGAAGAASDTFTLRVGYDYIP